MKDILPPLKYLGAKCGKYNLGDSEAWYMSAELYLHHAINEVERKWGNITKMAARQDLDVPVPQKYSPEIDTTIFKMMTPNYIKTTLDYCDGMSYLGG